MTDERTTRAPSAPGTPLDTARDLGTPTDHDGIVVGAGRRGMTARANWAVDGTAVAIKVGWERLDGERARRRFAAAAATLTSLRPTPHVVAVLDAGIAPDGQPWLITPWSVNGSLADRLTRGPLDVAEALLAAHHTASGLLELSAAGLVHANLTPGNLLIGGDGTVAVDGVSLPQLLPRWEPGPVAAHVPPEVVEGGPWTGQGDVWAWASVVHTLLHGLPPWAAAAQRGPSALLLAMATGEASGMRRVDVPDAISRLLDSALSVEPGDRPEGAAALIAALTPSASSRATTLVPTSPSTEPFGRPLGSSYLLKHPLGAGASGQVWLAERRWDHAPVAVKVLKAELATNPEQVARFLRERTTLVGLTHPNLVPVLDLVAEGETLAIVMGLVDGQDLRRLLTERATLAPSELCWLLAQVTSGVAAMHAAGIVHRDIKPENVLVETAPDGQGVARVTDFGLARALSGPALTRNTQLVGTVEYLAPELVAGRPLSPAVDLYSLGVMAYEMACGWRPFTGDHPAAILRAHLDGVPARPPGVPAALWTIIARCLAKEPGQRPDAAALHDELLAVAPTMLGTAAGDPAAWRPPGPDDGQRLGETDIGRTPREGGGAPEPEADLPDPPSPSSPASGPPTGPPLPANSTGDAPPGPTDLSLPPLRRGHRPGADPVAPADRRSPWRNRVLVGAAVLVVGAGSGVGWALTHRTTVGTGGAVDVTTSVTATGPGTVTLSYQPTDDPSLSGYIVIKRASPSAPYTATPPPNGAGSTFELTGQSPGRHCYQLEALLSQKPKKPTPGLGFAKECVTIP